MKPTPPIPKPEWVHRFALQLCRRLRLVGMTTASSLAEEAYARDTDPEKAADAYKPNCDFGRTIRLHNWPPGFVPHGSADPGALKRQEAAARGRETQLANGHSGSVRNGLSYKSVAVKSDISKAMVRKAVKA